MMLFYLVLLLVIFGGLAFFVALFLERLVFKPKEGTSRIFRAAFVSALLVGAVVAVGIKLISSGEATLWAVFLGISFFAYVGSLVPAWARWAIVKRHAAKQNDNVYETFR